jgi:hypothetical protein
MKLYMKLIIGLIIDAVLLGSTYIYFWKMKEEYYFPDRYETAYSAMGNITLLCIGILIIILIYHHVVIRKR